jgi:ABC-type antimicrobial peptide transport system permease subunit
MLVNYLRSAIRNLRQNKLFSVINVLGLSIGISASLVIYLIVHHDLSFDHFEKDGDRIFRVVTESSFQGNISRGRGTPAPLGEAVRKELSGIDLTVVFRYFSATTVAVPGADSAKPAVYRYPQGIIWADDDYFRLLPYHWLAGTPASLRSPGQVVLDGTRARLYFPGLAYQDMIGKRIIYNDSIATAVSGIVDDLDRSGNTDFNFGQFISLNTLISSAEKRKQVWWDDWNSITSDQELYVRLQSHVQPATVEAGLRAIHQKYEGPKSDPTGFKSTYLLQPLDDIHFNRKYGTFSPDMADRSVMAGLMLVAGFLLFLGCINFINLTTAQSAQRAREIGIRKTLGGGRQQLIFQFLGETFVVTAVATLLSLALTPLLLRVFADFIPKEVSYSFGSLVRQPNLILFLVLLVLGVTGLAGFYPALVLSATRPVQVLKNQAYTGTSKTRTAWVRQTLTVFQFVIAQAFVICMWVVAKQIRYLLDKDLGFKKEAIISFRVPRNDRSMDNRLYLLRELTRIPGISMTSLANDVPSSGNTTSTIMEYQDGKKKIQTSVELKYGDSNYLSLFHIPLVAGRKLLPSDTIREILINEHYANLLGFKDPGDALGKTLPWNNKKLAIVGVLHDFYSHTLMKDIQPLAYVQGTDNRRTLIAALQPRASGTDWQNTITGIQAIYKKTYPDEEFNYAFFDESIANAYRMEQRVLALLKWATGLTIFISCLGLLGLVIYTTSRRTKEIGIRKVLGASVTNILSVLSKDFLKLVCIAFLIAAPVAWWLVHRWVDQYAVRTAIPWWLFLLSGLGMVGIALATLSLQTIRTATAKPVDSLRTE